MNSRALNLVTRLGQEVRRSQVAKSGIGWGRVDGAVTRGPRPVPRAQLCVCEWGVRSPLPHFSLRLCRLGGGLEAPAQRPEMRWGPAGLLPPWIRTCRVIVSQQTPPRPRPPTTPGQAGPWAALVPGAPRARWWVSNTFPSAVAGAWPGPHLTDKAAEGWGWRAHQGPRLGVTEALGEGRGGDRRDRLKCPVLGGVLQGGRRGRLASSVTVG